MEKQVRRKPRMHLSRLQKRQIVWWYVKHDKTYKELAYAYNTNVSVIASVISKFAAKTIREAYPLEATEIPTYTLEEIRASIVAIWGENEPTLF